MDVSRIVPLRANSMLVKVVVLWESNVHEGIRRHGDGGGGTEVVATGSRENNI